MAAETDPLKWCCHACHRPVIDRDPYALTREVSPFATIGDIMGGAAIPPIWRPIARWWWIRLLEKSVRRELEQQSAFERRIGVRA
jgi:hypothetical protein